MIEQFGWSPALQDAFAPFAAQGLSPARVTAQHRDVWTVITPLGELVARVSGRMTHEAAHGGLPVVGDWAATDAAGLVIHGLMARRGVIQRRAAGAVGVQVLAAQVDVALLAMSMNDDLNVRRLERYLVTAKANGVACVIVLSKADLCADPAAVVGAVGAVAGDTPVVTVTTAAPDGHSGVSTFLEAGRTAVLLGSSGVGKSTLLNRLMGYDAMDTGAIREADSKGRHTTRHRALFRLPGGALLIDTPGLREFGLAVEADAVDASFTDVTALFDQCRFGDCTHKGEPGCGVQAALDDGALLPGRWEAYQKLVREQAYEGRRTDLGAQAAERAKWKKIHKGQRAKAKLRNQQTDWD